MPTMRRPVDMDTSGEKVEHGWRDRLGFVGPLQPGSGGRRDPVGEFPTGPAVGERLPDVLAPNHDGQMVDAHVERGNGPLVMVFFRSAVW